jgi:ribonuclease VapC
MFVDASALCAILLDEDDAEKISRSLESATLTSPLAIYETALAVTRVRAGSLVQAESEVRKLLSRANVAVVPIESDTVPLALNAHERYGKGRHPARLNLGDCFAYAMAKQHDLPLLYTGDDFLHTDLA